MKDRLVGIGAVSVIAASLFIRGAQLNNPTIVGWGIIAAFLAFALFLAALITGKLS